MMFSLDFPRIFTKSVMDYAMLQLAVVGKLAVHADVCDLGDRVFTDAASNQVHLTTDEGCTAEANSGSTTCCCPRTQELHKCGREQIVLQPLPADAGAPHVRRVQQPGAAVD